jgi:hypothetical protein
MLPGQTGQHTSDRVSLAQDVIEVCCGHCGCLNAIAGALCSPCLLQQEREGMGGSGAKCMPPHVMTMAFWGGVFLLRHAI